MRIYLSRNRILVGMLAELKRALEVADGKLLEHKFGWLFSRRSHPVDVEGIVGDDDFNIRFRKTYGVDVGGEVVAMIGDVDRDIVCWAAPAFRAIGGATITASLFVLMLHIEVDAAPLALR